jgi:hypothetical protein
MANGNVPTAIECVQFESGGLTMSKRMKPWLTILSLALFSVPAYRVMAGKAIIASTFGEWDCACGDWHVKTTRLAIWNPLRDQTPEKAAEAFLHGLRDNNCKAALDLCQSVVQNHRVSNWKLAYREDKGDSATLYLKLTKHGGGPEYELTGEGALTVQRRGDEWVVTGYDAYF